ncbi:MAG: glutathione synthase [SAR86 cluster bacterium]|uniref:Glutathione synthetase n=1 Tax=SAR86 cluster bacterium TaxID=2030880 RepID=A0A2A5CIU8_9GAMM|nr:MAG: glutathione synthase [SAR86 cluster bacterium]
MSVKLAVVMDPIQDISAKKDSTLAMLLAAQDKGWSLAYIEQTGLYLDDGIAMAETSVLSVADDPQNWYSLSDPRRQALSEFDVILMRKDPPFDNEYIYSTYILEAAERQGVLIVNKPQSLRDCNEKVFATQFPQCCTPVLVASSPTLLREFYAQHEDVIFKPLDGMGGASIFRIKPNDPNLSVIIETLTDFGKHQIMAQKFIPEIKAGDKRILMIDGQAVDYALARIPAPNETRGNLAAGGSAKGIPLTDRDRWICEQIGPTLKEKGLIFVGLDVIGDYLTEINVTSPTCIRELNAAFDLDIGGDLMECIAAKLEN